MLVKHGAGKIKTVTTIAGSQEVESDDKASIVKFEGKTMTAKLGNKEFIVELGDLESIKEVKELKGKKLASYVIEKCNEQDK